MQTLTSNRITVSLPYLCVRVKFKNINVQLHFMYSAISEMRVHTYVVNLLLTDCII
jgi:hypothetical protein